MLDVRRLRLLRELSHRGTIAAVAEALVLTPSAVSQQLAVLERETGVPLLERSGRRVVLTPAARTLVRHTEVVLDRLERAGAELVRARQGLAGPVRLGTFPTAARAIVPAALVALAERHPGLEPMLSEIDPARLPDALRAGELDLALTHDYDVVPVPPEPGVAVEPLCVEAVFVAARRDTPGDPGTPGLSRWRDEPWIIALPGTSCEVATLRACEAAGFAPRVRHRVDEFATVLALVAAGQGVALVPRLALVAVPAEVALEPLPVHRRTGVAHRAGAARHPAVAAVTAALRESVPPDLTAAP
ncbi:LysR family transcriptional regulator [Pseudonocardia humida]|uniref:LysR family transcriptional regulator n=1 Tax=Pseudonocardia humida TaxID=2800819 RepID=A0ABT1A1W8_9PSEU|nr:LysR family transcriptional regulator [Pseudonocardia humida]MCO1656946.1 LysR family transcriptional regulator [Pseudonocardia humida]